MLVLTLATAVLVASTFSQDAQLIECHCNEEDERCQLGSDGELHCKAYHCTLIYHYKKGLEEPMKTERRCGDDVHFRYPGHGMSPQCGSQAQVKGLISEMKCCETMNCNNSTWRPESSFTSEVTNGRISAGEGLDPPRIALAVAAPVLGLCIFVSAVFFFWYKCVPSPQTMLPKGRMDEIYSGSGSGLPLLGQRTIAKQITLVQLIGRGRYGEVYKGQWQGELVAVKLFPSREECSWKRECEVYETGGLSQENVLRFIAADRRDTGQITQLWLVTDYCAFGSLYDYLQTSTVDTDGCLTMCHGLAAGLAHLHLQIPRGKPAIAHRDVKSKNILVKSNKEVCIADFGLAVWDSSIEKRELPPASNVGTKRYMAPEILDGSFETASFSAYKAADIYAFGLVLWEIMRRCTANGVADEPALPYFDCVNSDPSEEEMKTAVCDRRRRPALSPRWAASQHLTSLAELVTECWDGNYMVRNSALRSRKSIVALRNGGLSGVCEEQLLSIRVSDIV